MNTQTSRLLTGMALSVIAASVLIGCSDSRDASTTTTQPGTPSMGTQVDDTAITASVKSALMAEPNISSLDIGVETRQGTVQLSGSVDNQGQIDQAVTVARGVTGVTNVTHSVNVRGSTGAAAGGADTTIGTQMDDTAVTARVKAALLADTRVSGLDINVETVQGVVQLAGAVENQAQIEQAAQIALSAGGARSVKNDLTIKQ